MELWFDILVDLGDDEVAPVDESDHFPLCEGLSIGSFYQNSRSIPNFLHPHLSILDGRTNDGDISEMRYSLVHVVGQAFYLSITTPHRKDVLLHILKTIQLHSVW